jgi:hypothetical protein
MALTGGDKLAAKLAAIAKRLGGNPEVRVGFLENSVYDDGTSVPMVAAINEFGASIQREAGQVTIYRSLDKQGDFLKGGRFVKASKSNYATTHAHGPYTITIPPRPFMRNTVAKHKADWPKAAAKLLVAQNYDIVATMTLVGEGIKSQMQQEITDFKDPPNAPGTIARKGFNKPLIDSGFMRNSIGVEVKT